MTVDLTIRGPWVRVVGEADIINELCSYFDPDAEHSKEFQAGHWDGTRTLFKRGEFPIGLLPRVEMGLALGSTPYTITDKRQPTADPQPITPDVTLRDYQEDIVALMIKQGCGVVQAPTGSGKTVMYLAMMCRMGLPSLVVVPTLHLVDQTLAAMDRVGGLVVPHITSEWLKRYVFSTRVVANPFWGVATWQTLAAVIRNADKVQRERFREFMAGFDILIYDEVHHEGAEKVYDTAVWCPARYRFGMSATPNRGEKGDDTRMYGGVGEPIGGISATELIERGFLVKPTIRFLTPERPDEFGRGKWQDVYKKNVVLNMDRNLMAVDAAVQMVKEGRSTLIMCTQINHGKILVGLLQQDVPEAVFVHGSITPKQRREWTTGFRDGTIPAAVSSTVWQEGIDLPLVAGGVMAGPHKSPVISMQWLGRLLRIHPGKKDTKLIDFNDWGLYLRDWSIQRKETYKLEEGFNVVG